uniref:PPUP7773 n=1 Tax=Poeciliopsis prolifica TaxID=188132 RepID=A0A0S7ESU1_9TELE
MCRSKTEGENTVEIHQRLPVIQFDVKQLFHNCPLLHTSHKHNTQCIHWEFEPPTLHPSWSEGRMELNTRQCKQKISPTVGLVTVGSPAYGMANQLTHLNQLVELLPLRFIKF